VAQAFHVRPHGAAPIIAIYVFIALVVSRELSRGLASGIANAWHWGLTCRREVEVLNGIVFCGYFALFAILCRGYALCWIEFFFFFVKKGLEPS